MRRGEIVRKGGRRIVRRRGGRRIVRRRGEIVRRRGAEE